MPYAPALALVVVSALLMGCQTTTQPASQRGFFSGLGAAVTGADERQARGLEQQAASEEAKAQRMAQRAAEADRQARTSGAQVRTAEQRLATLQADVENQRKRLAALKAGRRSGVDIAEADRIQLELDELDRAQRQAAAQVSSITPGTLQSLENRARQIDSALAKLGSV